MCLFALSPGICPRHDTRMDRQNQHSFRHCCHSSCLGGLHPPVHLFISILQHCYCHCHPCLCHFLGLKGKFFFLWIGRWTGCLTSGRTAYPEMANIPFDKNRSMHTHAYIGQILDSFQSALVTFHPFIQSKTDKPYLIQFFLLIRLIYDM